MAIEVEMKGLTRLQSRIRGNVTQARKETLREGEAVAKENCPVSDISDPGYVHLIETIRVVGVNQYADDLVAGDASRGKDYGPAVEFGTINAPAQPFMGPAADHMKKVYPQKVRKYLVR